MPPRGPTSTAVPATRTSPSDATGWRPARSPRLRRARASTWSSSRRTRCSTAADRRAWATGPATRRADQCVRRLEARGRGGRRRRVRAGRLRSSRSSAPPGCSARPGNDFPAKILAAAERAPAAGEALRAVADETGSPTYAADLAEAIVELLGSGRVRGDPPCGERGRRTRADWAREVLRLAGIDVQIEEVPATTWPRPRVPPRWAVLEPTPLPSGEPLRPWPEALADYMVIRLR